MKRKWIILCGLMLWGFLLAKTEPLQARIITVDDDGPADFNTIQAAIDDANDGDVVIVAAGTYTGDGNCDIDFKGKAITVRSIDPNDHNVVASTVIDCQSQGRGFYFHSGEGNYSVVAGVTIKNGGYYYGSGICCDYSSPTITRCIITANRGSIGGGICCIDAHTTKITFCKIIGNSAYAGGGVCIVGERDYSSATISNCLITGNLAHGEDGGGGIFISETRSTSSIVNQCTIVGNSAPNGHGGGALYVVGCYDSIINTIIWSNSATYGSQMAEWGGMMGGEWVHLNISYSDIQGGKEAIWQYAGDFYWLAGNINADPCFAESGYWDPNGTPQNPKDDFWVDGNYHLKSQAGRYDPNSQNWVKDDVTSLCIDAGNPASPIGLEPFPNGGIINMGAYGGTTEASKSYFGEPVCETIVAGDINGDCKVDFWDLALMTNHWLEEH